MRTITLFDQSTGEFRRVLTIPDRAVAANVPRGFGFKEGRFDRLSQRVDLDSGQVVDVQQPQPDDDHEWRESVVNGRPRWVKKQSVVERERRAAIAQREIDRLERSQARPVRELAADPTNVAAKERIADIEAQVVMLRQALKGST
jgi:hypothetical protein